MPLVVLGLAGAVFFYSYWFLNDKTLSVEDRLAGVGAAAGATAAIASATVALIIAPMRQQRKADDARHQRELKFRAAVRGLRDELDDGDVKRQLDSVRSLEYCLDDDRLTLRAAQWIAHILSDFVSPWCAPRRDSCPVPQPVLVAVEVLERLVQRRPRISIAVSKSDRERLCSSAVGDSPKDESRALGSARREMVVCESGSSISWDSSRWAPRRKEPRQANQTAAYTADTGGRPERVSSSGADLRRALAASLGGA